MFHAEPKLPPLEESLEEPVDLSAYIIGVIGQLGTVIEPRETLPFRPDLIGYPVPSECPDQRTRDLVQSAFGACVADGLCFGSLGFESSVESIVQLYCESMEYLNPKDHANQPDEQGHWPASLVSKAEELHIVLTVHQVCIRC